MSDWTPSGLASTGCHTCRHFDRRTFTCAAYPDGIPLPIASGDVDHHVRRPGQANDDVWLARGRGLLLRGAAGESEDLVDLVQRIGVRQHGINVHVFADGESHRISVPSRMRRRLERWSRATGITLHTVALDQRGGDTHSGHGYYHQRGIRSMTLDSMTKVQSAQHLRELVGR